MENMDYYNANGQNLQNMVPEPTIKDFIIWLGLPSLLGFFTCGIGSLILLIVWACSSKNSTRSNFAKAQLLVYVISIVIGILLYIVLGAAVFSSMSGVYY